MISAIDRLYLGTEGFAKSLPEPESLIWVSLAWELQRYETPCFWSDAGPNELMSAYKTLEPNEKIDELNERWKQSANPEVRRAVCRQIVEAFQGGKVLARTGMEHCWMSLGSVDTVVQIRDLVQTVQVVLPALIELRDREEAGILCERLRAVEESLAKATHDVCGYAGVLQKYLRTTVVESAFSIASMENQRQD